MLPPPTQIWVAIQISTNRPRVSGLGISATKLLTLTSAWPTSKKLFRVAALRTKQHTHTNCERGQELRLNCARFKSPTLQGIHPQTTSLELNNLSPKSSKHQTLPVGSGELSKHVHGLLSKKYGSFLGTLNIRCRIIIGIQKGTIILTTTHMTVRGCPYFDLLSHRSLPETLKTNRVSTLVNDKASI